MESSIVIEPKNVNGLHSQWRVTVFRDAMAYSSWTRTQLGETDIVLTQHRLKHSVWQKVEHLLKCVTLLHKHTPLHTTNMEKDWLSRFSSYVNPSHSPEVANTNYHLLASYERNVFKKRVDVSRVEVNTWVQSFVATRFEASN